MSVQESGTRGPKPPTSAQTQQRAQYLDALKEALNKSAEALVFEHAMMAVAGTPFDNTQTPAAQPLTPGVDHLALSSSATTPRNGELFADGVPSLVKKESMIRGAKQENIIKRASVIKCSAMWEVLCTASSYHMNLCEQFRYERLRRQLCILMLPHLLKRRLRGTLGNALPVDTKGPEDTASQGDRPSGAQLMQTCPWLAGMEDINFAEEVAQGMQKLSKLTGDDVVRADESSQGVLYYVAVGRYEWVTPAAPQATTSTPRHATGAANIPAQDPLAAPVAGGQRVVAPFCCGDVFGGPSRYLRSLYARSKGVVWYISKSSFDAMLESWSTQRTKNLFLAEAKKEMLYTIADNFPLAPNRIPLLRKMPINLLPTYFPQFEPVLLDRGTVLFEEGSNGGVVYVLCSGSVTRARRQTADEPNGCSQVLSVSASWQNTLRYALIGEEPHIVPEKHRYTCTVASDVFKGYRIPAALFANILLDDPRLLLRLREDALAQRASMMRLKVEALRQVPLLQDFPMSRLQTLHQLMTPKVVERSTMICQSQQPLRDIYVVVCGDIRDPKKPGVPPAVLPPAKPLSTNATTGASATASSNAASFVARPDGGARQVTMVVDDQSVANPSFAGIERTYSMAATNRMSFTGRRPVDLLSRTLSVNEATVVENEDTNPPLPVSQVNRILYALGGGWEGLLMEKWTTTWEAVGVVELWVLPTVAIRNEYNELHRSAQVSILHQLRVNQMRDLGLDEVPQTKLPPMSIYRTAGNAAASLFMDLKGQGAVDVSDGSKSSSQKRRGRADAKRHHSSTHSVSMSLESSVAGDPRSGGFATGGNESDSLVERDSRRHAVKASDARPALTAEKAPSPPRKVPSPRKGSPVSKKKLKSSEKNNSRGKRVGSPKKDGAQEATTDSSAADIAALRDAAQRHNEEQRLLRQMPLADVIRMETNRLRRGEHRSSAETLPPLTSREFRLYFDVDVPDTSARRGISPANSPTSRAMPLEKLQNLYYKGNPSDHAEEVDNENVIRTVGVAPSLEEVATTTNSAKAPKASVLKGVAAKLPPPFYNSPRSAALESEKRQLPPPLQLTLAKAMQRDVISVPKKPHTAQTNTSRGTQHRWFQRVPEKAPPFSWRPSNKEPSEQQMEAFDVLLMQTLKSAEAAQLTHKM